MPLPYQISLGVVVVSLIVMIVTAVMIINSAEGSNNTVSYVFYGIGAVGVIVGGVYSYYGYPKPAAEITPNGF